MQKVKQLIKTLRVLDEIPNINKGGCAIVAYALYKHIKSHIGKNIPMEFISVQKTYESKHSSHVYLYLPTFRKVVDTTGIIKQETLRQYVSPLVLKVLNAKDILRRINTLGSWNLHYSRDLNTVIADQLDVTLEEVKIQILSKRNRRKYYLQFIPNSAMFYGLTKVLMVRKFVIHLKHVFKYVFCKSSKEKINKIFNIIDYDVFDYMGYMTQHLRLILKIDRASSLYPKQVLKHQDSLFRDLEFYSAYNGILCIDLETIDSAFLGIILAKFTSIKIVLFYTSNNADLVENTPITNKLKKQLRLTNKEVRWVKYRNPKGYVNSILGLQQKHKYVTIVTPLTSTAELLWICGVNVYTPSINKVGKIAKLTFKT